ncbi:hypothetical protein C4E49_13350 [Morganella morganii]|nr:hypothetical protein C4E49_13350 [Morganella morganii]
MFVHKIKNKSHINKYIEDNGCLFISRYKDSHTRARKLARKMASEGIIKMQEVSGGFIYRKREVIK